VSWSTPAASNVNSYGKKNVDESDPIRHVRQHGDRRSVRRTAAPRFGSILGNSSRIGAGAVDPERYESVDGRLIDLLKYAFFDNPAAIEW